MEPSWYQNGIPNRSYIESAEKSKKHIKTIGISMILWVPGVEVGTQNRAKIDQNLKPKLKCLLASIFDRFWWFLGGKLGGKIEPRSIKKRSRKALEK